MKEIISLATFQEKRVNLNSNLEVSNKSESLSTDARLILNKRIPEFKWIFKFNKTTINI